MLEAVSDLRAFLRNSLRIKLMYGSVDRPLGKESGFSQLITVQVVCTPVGEQKVCSRGLIAK